MFVAIGYKAFSVGSIISCFLPIFTGRYWFITIYFGLYLLSPFLNILIHAMDKKQHLLLNVLLFFLMSGMVSVHPSFKGMNSGAGWGLSWFVTLYLAASWFRQYYHPTGECLLKLLLWVIFAGVVTVLYEIGPGPVKSIAENWYRYDSAPAYIMSLLVFIGFINVNIVNETIKRIIILSASSTFGVYLIHAHADFSPWSWEVLNMPEKMECLAFPGIQIIIVLGIYLLCILIDLLRKRTVGKIEKNRFIQKCCEKIQLKLFQCLEM